MDKIIITAIGVLGVFFVFWFFFMKKEEAIAAEGEVEIKVQGGYSPETISVSSGKPIKLVFLRTDDSSCLEEVVLSDFHVRKELPLNERVEIEVTPPKAGEYKFTCGMNMYHGKLIAK